MSPLRDLLLLITIAIPVAVVAQRIKVPALVGFLLTGLAVGPYGLGVVGDADAVAGMAELGVVLLMFAIGLELSLSRIIRMGGLVVQAGGLQVAITLGATAAIALAFGVPVRPALLLGALVAFSSTAIVLKLYSDRGELDSPHGRMAVAILIFQDLAIVPLLVLVPLLATDGGTAPTVGALLRFAASIAALMAMVALGRFLVPWTLERIVGLRNREIFTLCVAFFGLGAAYVAALLGLKLAIGAFLAGLVIAESEYGVHALSDVLPFRDVFSAVFFISVGMLLDLGFVADNAALIVGATVGVIVLKTMVISLVGPLVRRSTEVSVITALGLAQVGEFSFVLARAAEPYGILDATAAQLFLAASVLSMLASPLLIVVARPIAARVARITGHRSLETVPHEKSAIVDLHDHAIIVGYGLAGRYLARVLGTAGFPYVVLEQNGQTVRTGRQAGEPIFFGDGTRHEVLERVGIERARVIVYSIASPADERRGVSVARQLNPDIRIVVRTRYVASIDDLTGLGASDVVVEEFEAALELFARVLERYDLPPATVREEVETIRGEQYGFLRGETPPTLQMDALHHLALHRAIDIIEIEEGASAIGENPVSLDLRQRTGAVVVAVIRDDVPLHAPDPEFAFQADDAVVLVGDEEALGAARGLFKPT